MAVYSKHGEMLTAVYDKHGNPLRHAYNKYGDVIFNAEPSWIDEVTVEKLRNSATGTNYYFVKIPQTRTDGSKQYPFVYTPVGTGICTESALEVAERNNFHLVMNAGVGEVLGNGRYRIDGLTIEDSQVILNTPSAVHSTNPQAARPLTINGGGLLSYTEYNADAYDLVADGIVSCISGFMPIVVNGTVMTDWIDLWGSWKSADAQRQVIGQFTNGDYAVVTAEGRNFDNSTGMTVNQTAELCVSLGLKFAYLCDGGGSAETVIDGEQLNVIYEGTKGRKVPSFIVFNGADHFGDVH